MKIILILIGFMFLSNFMYAQNMKDNDQFLSFSIAGGSKQLSTVLQYQYLWNFGKKKHWQMGTGVRLTNNFGFQHYYITAPAILTSGKTGPAVFFAEQIVQNIDSIYLNKSQVNLINITVNFGYYISKKLQVGFNIDAVGFSFAAKKNATYFGNAGIVKAASVKPTAFNLLLISDNDLGSLNSEFFASYDIYKKWSAKIGFQFLFTEYTSTTKVQITPSGKLNDRFRNKVGQFSLGTIYNF